MKATKKAKKNKIKLNAKNTIKPNIGTVVRMPTKFKNINEIQAAYRQGAKDLLDEHDAAVAYWAYSLRNPSQIRDARIPQPFPISSALCTLKGTFGITVEATSGTMEISWQGQTTYLFHCYLASNFQYTSWGTDSSFEKSPFLESGKPVYGYPHRLVSGSVTVIPIDPVSTAKGTYTLCNFPEKPGTPVADKAFDHFRDQPGAKVIQAIESATLLYEPYDPSAITFYNGTATYPTGMILFDKVNPGATFMISYVLNMEFLPKDNLDFFQLGKTPYGNPNNLQHYLDKPKSWFAGKFGDYFKAGVRFLKDEFIPKPFQNLMSDLGQIGKSRKNVSSGVTDSGNVHLSE